MADNMEQYIRIPIEDVKKIFAKNWEILSPELQNLLKLIDVTPCLNTQ